MEQGTNDWLLWRNKGIGSSDVAIILGISPWKTAFRLWQEKRGEVEVESGENFATKRGHDNEGKARAHVELITGKEWPAELVIDEVRPHYRVSLDGRCGDEILEIKVPSIALVEAVETKGLEGVPEYYMAQMQYQLLVTKAVRCLFVCFHPEKNKISSVWVHPDKKWIAKIEKAVDAFWNCILSGEQPAMTDKDFIELDDAKFLSDAESYRILSTEISKLEDQLSEIKERILEQAKVHPAISGGGIRVSGYTVKGNVDYSAIPELKLVNLESYRKPPRKQYRITIEKNKEQEL